MRSEIPGLIKLGEKISADLQNTFGEFSDEKLNWKPTAKKWSVGECIEHLLIMNQKYTPILIEFSQGTYKPSFFEKMKLGKNFWGNFLIKALQPGNTKKYSAPSRSKPVRSNVSASIVNEFIETQTILLKVYFELEKIDTKKIVMSSPFAKPIVYSVFDALNIVILHQQRHYNQAMRVTKTEGFPK